MPSNRRVARRHWRAFKSVKPNRLSAGTFVLVVLLGGAPFLLLLWCIVDISFRPRSTVAEELTALTDQNDQNGDIRLPLSRFDEGSVRFFQYSTTGGTSVRLIVSRPAADEVRVGFDACEPCARERRGFRQEGQSLVCNACGRRFSASDRFHTECAPLPLQHELSGGDLVLRASVLEAGARYFEP